MGKRDKEHRKKVTARNQQIKGAQKKYQEMMNEKMMQYLKEMKEKSEQEVDAPTTQSGFTLV
jgi:hypothetical protein